MTAVQVLFERFVTSGYEPKPSPLRLGLMSMQHRRRATRQELAQGEAEMKKAHERMQKEAQERGELPLGNGGIDDGGQGTPATTAAIPATEASHSTTKATEVTDLRTPDDKKKAGPKTVEAEKPPGTSRSVKSTPMKEAEDQRSEGRLGKGQV